MVYCVVSDPSPARHLGRVGWFSRSWRMPISSVDRRGSFDNRTPLEGPMHHVKSPRLRLAAMALAAAWIGAGCHDDVTVAGTSTTPERSSETGAARSLDGVAQDLADASNGVVSVTDAACVAERVVPSLSDAGYRGLQSGSPYFERLSDEDRQVFVDGFGACVQPKVYATLLTQGLDNALFPLGDAGAGCVVDRIGTERTTAELASMALSDQDATAGVVAEAVGTCVSAPELQAGLAAHLVRVDGLDDTAASCVAGRLIDGSASAELLGQLLLRAGGREEAKTSLAATIENATQTCT